jgi:hypothetical protein
MEERFMVLSSTHSKESMDDLTSEIMEQSYISTNSSEGRSLPVAEDFKPMARSPLSNGVVTHSPLLAAEPLLSAGAQILGTSPGTSDTAFIGQPALPFIRKLSFISCSCDANFWLPF